MSFDQLRTYVKAKPFRPFTIHTADGRALRVPHVEFVSQSPSGRTVIVYGEGDLHTVVDTLMITALDVETAIEDMA